MKKSHSIALLFAIATLTVCVGAGCDVNIGASNKEHVCSYEEFAPTQLRQETSGKAETHDIVKNGLLNVWQQDSETPVAYAYSMAHEYTIPSDTKITLGKNVYVGVCTHSSTLNFTEDQIELSYEEVTDENGVVVSKTAVSGFYVYDCEAHGCYAALKVAQEISEDYLTFGYHYARAKGNANFTLQAGSYSLKDECFLSEMVDNGKLVFANAASTEICTNNLTGGNMVTETAALRALGVTVYTECRETITDHIKHTCAYIPQEGMSIPLDQVTLDTLVDAFLKDGVSIDKENPLNNYVYAHLTEDVEYEGALSIPDGFYFGICKNGFDFDVQGCDNLYVFDCEPHVCIHTDYKEMIPLWQAGLDMSAAYMNALHTAYPENYPQTVVLPTGAYALMEDLTSFPVVLADDGEYSLCRNGHTIAGMEDKLVDGEYIWDCTEPITWTEEETQETVEIPVHACTQVSPHITAIPATIADAASLIDQNGVMQIGKREVAMALAEDYVMGITITIPSGAKVHLCLNGHTITATAGLAEDGDSPYLFKVEYGAELHIYDCSAEKTGALIAATEDMYVAEGSKTSGLASPVYNLGSLILRGVTLKGGTAVYNSGWLSAKDSNLIGFYFGVMMGVADNDSSPLHTLKPSVETDDCLIDATGMGVLAFGGDIDAKDTQINATLCGVMSNFELGALGTEQYQGDVVLENVEINLTANYPEGGQNWNMFVQSMGGVAGVATDSKVVLNGDITVNVDEKLLQPFENDKGQIITPISAEFFLSENAAIEIGDGVELTDIYEVYMQADDDSTLNGKVLANADLSDNFILMQGLAGAVNANGEYTVVLADGFMENASFIDVSVSFEGYVRLEVYCRFDYYAEYASFLRDADASVLLTVADEKISINPNAMKPVGNNTYYYSVDFFAKDYQDKIRVQFTNGDYTWTGMTSVSVEDFLEYSLKGMEKQISENEEILTLDAAEKAAAAGSADPTSFVYTYTEEQVADAKRLKEQGVAYKNAIVAMLNYCDVAALQFGVDGDYTLLDKEFSHKSTVTVSDEETQEEITQEIWTNTTLADAMDGVTAEKLSAYKAAVGENAVVPAGVTFVGASLILNSGTDIRFYFRASAETLKGLTITLNGETAEALAYSGNIYYVQVTNLAATELKDMYTLGVSDGVDTFTISYGVFSYMYGVLSNENADETLVKVAKATWLYADEIEKTIAALSALQSAEE